MTFCGRILARVTDYENRFAEAERCSKLPDHPDPDTIGHFVEGINRNVVREEIE